MNSRFIHHQEVYLNSFGPHFFQTWHSSWIVKITNCLILRTLWHALKNPHNDSSLFKTPCPVMKIPISFDFLINIFSLRTGLTKKNFLVQKNTPAVHTLLWDIHRRKVLTPGCIWHKHFFVNQFWLTSRCFNHKQVSSPRWGIRWGVDDAYE